MVLSWLTLDHQEVNQDFTTRLEDKKDSGLKVINKYKVSFSKSVFSFNLDNSKELNSSVVYTFTS